VVVRVGQSRMSIWMPLRRSNRPPLQLVTQLLPRVPLMGRTRTPPAPAKKGRVILGTLNILGNAKNPIEFCPQHFTSLPWRNASDAFRKSLLGVTFK
jgi:hypothetical protein